LESSHGFRPKRSAHDAVRTLNRGVNQGKVNGIFEADLVSFFDRLDRTELKKRLEVRVAEGSRWRLMGKCLHVGDSTARCFRSLSWVPSRGRRSHRYEVIFISTMSSTCGLKSR
jgi:hypothetical protein